MKRLDTTHELEIDSWSSSDLHLEDLNFSDIYVDHGGAHHGDLCDTSGHLGSSSSAKLGFNAMLHTDLDLHSKHFIFTDISGHQTCGNIGDLCGNIGNFISSCSKFSRLGYIACNRGKSRRARANHGNINSMADAELVHTYGSMAIDMMYQIHEIVSVGDGNKQIDWCSEDADKDGSEVEPMIDFGVSLDVIEYKLVMFPRICHICLEN